LIEAHSLKTFRISLAAVLTLSLVLHILTLWREKNDIAAAHGDFIIFYTGSQILLDGKAESLYDLKVQKEYQERFDIRIRPDPLPYNHPAYELLLFLPLARLSYTSAFIVWGIVNIFTVAGIVCLLSSTVNPGNKTLAALLCAAFFPVTATLWHGQDSILSTFLAAAVLVNLRCGRDTLAGTVLALGLYKPQLVFPIALILAIHRRWKVILPFMVVGGILVCISIAMTGWSGAIQYVRLLSWINQTHYTIDPAHMPNLRGMFENLSSIGIPREIIFLTTAGTSICTLYWSVLQWKSSDTTNDTMFDLSFSHVIVATLLVSYHLYVHDLTLLAIPLVTLLNHGASAGRDAPMVRNAILVALIVLSLPIVSLLLSHRLMSWTAIGLSLLGVVLSHECRQAGIEHRRRANLSPDYS
jgi:Glycosyltransferase family 87